MNRGNIVNILQDLSTNFFDKKILYYYKLEKDKLIQHSLSFKELDDISSSLAFYLQESGIKRGDRILIFIPVTEYLYIYLLAIFKIGGIATIIEPTLSLRDIDYCIRIANPVCFIGMKNLNIYKLFLPSLRKIPFSITADNDDFLSNIKNKFNFSYKIASLNGDETAIITFTSGSTGVPKGIERSHNSLVIQMEYLKKILNFSEDDIEMTNLPLFVLNSIANRIKVVLPYIKNYKLKDIEPSIIWKEIREMNVNRLTGSPFFIEKIMNMVEKENLIKKIFTGGGIVSSFLVKRLVDLNIDVNIVYGSTEAEPISIINGREIIKDEEKEGVNVGIPIEDIELKIIKIEKSNSIIDFTKSDKSNFIVENGKIGEIIVKGKNVNRSYFKDINAILYNKIKDIDGEVYHRTGDTGFIGKNGNLYITGRKDFSIILNNEVLNTFYIQNRLNRIKGVKKSAIIQDKKGKIYIFIEKEKKSRKKLIISDIKKIIDFDFSIRFLKRIPLDKRHNTKIDYGKLLKLL